jgi:hypothetical protein
MPVYNINGTDIIDGLATVATGAPVGLSHDDPTRTKHVSDPQATLGKYDGKYAREEWSTLGGTLPSASGDTAFAASGADATVTLAAATTRSHVVFGASWSYETAPASGYLSVESPSGIEVYREAVTAAGPGSVTFPKGLRGGVGSSLVVRLKDGSANKRVSLLGRRVE